MKKLICLFLLSLSFFATAQAQKTVAKKPQTSQKTTLKDSTETALIVCGEPTRYGRRIFFPKTGLMIDGVRLKDKYVFDTIMMYNTYSGMDIAKDQRNTVLREHLIGVLMYTEQKILQDSLISVVDSFNLTWRNPFYNLAVDDLPYLTIQELKDLIAQLQELEKNPYEKDKEPTPDQSLIPSQGVLYQKPTTVERTKTKWYYPEPGEIEPKGWLKRKLWNNYLKNRF